MELLARLDALLHTPDPPCLPARKRHYTCGGAWWRREAIKRDLAFAYARHQLAEAQDVSRIEAVRKH